MVRAVGLDRRGAARHRILGRDPGARGQDEYRAHAWVPELSGGRPDR